MDVRETQRKGFSKPIGSCCNKKAMSGRDRPAAHGLASHGEGPLPVLAPIRAARGKRNRRKPSGLRQDFDMGHGLASFRGVGMAPVRRTNLYHTRKWFSVKSGGGRLTGDGDHSSGGCQPALAQRRLASTMTALFMFSTTAVTRPMAVRPTRCVPAASQAK
jgi:hypothetical protein